MTEILVLIDSPDWAFARRVEAIIRYAPPGEFCFNVVCYPKVDLRTIPYGRYDLVWCLAPSKLPIIREVMGATGLSRPLLGSFNSGVGRADYHLAQATAAADWVIVNNHAAWAAGVGRTRDYNACCISNGVDLGIYRMRTPLAEREPRIIWCASQSKADDTADVKGYRLIMKPLQQILEARGVATEFLIVDDLPLREREMVEFYNRGTIVVCASSSEGTPNFLLEAAACGCAVVTTNVGNVPELITHGENGLIVYERNTGSMLEAVKMALDTGGWFQRAMQADLKAWHWQRRAPWYYAVFNRLAVGEAMQPFSWIDTPYDQI